MLKASHYDAPHRVCEFASKNNVYGLEFEHRFKRYTKVSFYCAIIRYFAYHMTRFHIDYNNRDILQFFDNLLSHIL